jgi:hypothetical protein
MLTRIDNGVEYAISFDFMDEAAAHLLARLPALTRVALERAAEATTVRGRTVEFEQPLRVQLEARVGPLQRSPREVFAPLLVHRVD